MSDVLINIESVGKKYGKFSALSDVNLQLDKGKIVGLCGPNGAGKTTLIKIMVGLIRDFQGEITIAGHELGVNSRARISYLPDYEFISKYTTGEKMIRAYSDLFPDFDVHKCMQLFERMNLPLNVSANKLSKGMREKFQLALCLARDAQIYIIDEPIAAVDPASRDSIIETILTTYSQDALLLIATHIIQDIESVLDEVVFLNQGSVILHRNCDELREERGQTIDEIFREEFKW